MRILVVGAGASGVMAAICYKRNHPSDEVLIIEQLDKPLKKLLATGNGKCNLGNKSIDFSLFNNEEFAKSVILGYDYNEFFDSICIKTKLVGDLAYPISESAVSVKDALLNELNKLGIKINLSETLIDYETGDKITVKTNKNEYKVDKLVLTGGLKSSSKLGSNGSVFEILKAHGYETKEPKPGLSPIYTTEKTKEIDGIRVKANVKVFGNNELIHEEMGEVLFKDHGLSGIVIFNSMSYLQRNNYNSNKIYIDLLPDFSKDYLNDYLEKNGTKNLLLAFINPKIGTYLTNRYGLNRIVEGIKELSFTFDKSYGFEFSQVSVGGVSLNMVNEAFESKLEKNIYLLGELLDIDGPCGGYNLTWAFASAQKFGK